MSDPRIPPELLRRAQRARDLVAGRGPMIPPDVMERARQAQASASAPDEPHNGAHDQQDDEQRPQHEQASLLHPKVQFPQLYDKAYLQSALAAGLTYGDIANALGCSRPSVYHALRRAGLIVIPRPDIEHRLLSDRAYVYAMIERGLSLREMAQEADAAIYTVRGWLGHYALVKAQREAYQARIGIRKTENTTRRRAERVRYPDGKYPQLRDLDWLQQQLETRTMTEIANEVGCAISTISRIVERKGLQYRGTLHRMAHMSDTTYTFPQTDPHPAPRGAAFGTNYGMVNAFKDYLKANPNLWFELGVVKTGGIGISNGKGFEFTTRSRDADGNHYLVEGSTNPDGTPRRGVRVWGRYNPANA